MTTRTQESPFRETAWDQRLDKMLDDLKTTVTPDGERTSSRKDNSLVSSFRSTSRSDSRGSEERSCVEDGGLMKHHHKEYTSPDRTTRVVTDQFEYQTDDPTKYQKKVMKSTYSQYKVSGDISTDLDSFRKGPDPPIMDLATRTTSSSEFQTDTKVVSASQRVANKLVDALSSIGPLNSDHSSQSTSATTSSSFSKNNNNNIDKNNFNTRGLTNGKLGYNEDDELLNDPTGEVKRIVWRNRFEKTYEGHDGTPSISIEEEARRRHYKNYDTNKVSSPSTVTTFQPQPPQMSPGSQSWADPIPMPTPPQVSPKGEPGVAYVYTYGQSNTSSQVQHLPPLNYVTMPSGASVPSSEGGAPSPTPSGTQPIIYHYSYHYTLQPGQPVPDGIPQPPGGLAAPPLPVAPTSPHTALLKVDNHHPTTHSTNIIQSSYDYKNKHTNTRNSTTHHHTPQESTTPTYPVDESEEPPRYPVQGPPYDDEQPPPLLRDIDPSSSQRDIEPPSTLRGGDLSITRINKTTTTSSSNTSHVTTHNKDFVPGAPSTSTPFPTPTRSRSSSPTDRYYIRGGPSSSPYGTQTHIHRMSYSDSLDRVRRPPAEGLPFPDTSPIKPRGNARIPRRIDDLMTSLSDAEDGPNRGPPHPTGNPQQLNGPNGPKAPPENEPLINGKVILRSANVCVGEEEPRSVSLVKKKEETRNVAGPPVYYPPGHNQLFDESMHTMTLKENKRRGMAKWRAERASGYKESSSSSESKGGMAMVPVCLPLCCGAACVVM